MPLIFRPFFRYAEFSGRARRAEYWLFTLLIGVVFFGYALAASVLSVRSEVIVIAAGTVILFGLASLIPSVAVAIRRLHDIDRPAVWILVGLVPIIGQVMFLVFALTDGTEGANRYGPDPKGRPPRAHGAVVREIHHYHNGSRPPSDTPTPVS